ncbi:HlyD family efflux transporter periplasmic adaptor subunit [Planktothrix sp. FACHB-1355]|uniref:HlyD family efflux transporter periplasmic adaptor subunit n=1 Tax=Aerosakkonema funiforme FACHB-1375 TaxID=2949571 RepID=A0A926VB20_9CYAN|nr:MULTISPECIES: HlyD family efflux transporter periplasmic adaptor subunit [Oscillatoriales]MBD2180574.1 HlyD family efflux transporter periplasmic adaptor subunit [Aerosakkonema funiforme FACHB-1375]MBD3559935.1 HlyD family efflux transporter periplasmic adaptor subunit [Planktothrix sp. FACHB-1355]
MPNTSNSFAGFELNHHELQTLSNEAEFPNSTNGKVTHTDDWSYATKELLDSLPKTWTRGLLYFLVIFVAIVLPWSMLYKVDETGTARGRLELKGDTVKREADIQGSVAVVKVRVKEGDEIKANQILVELDSKSVRDEIQQNEIKLSGQQNRFSQLEIQKNQLGIAIAAQQQQNKVQELEKQTQVAQAEQSFDTLKTAYNFQKEEKIAQLAQAQQNFDALKTTYNFQKEEKLAQVAQVRQSIESSQAAYNLAAVRLEKAQEKFQRHKLAFDGGAISKDRFAEVVQSVEESYQQRRQAQSDISQTQSRLTEQQGSYEKIIHQAESDIKQAELRLKEQQGNYQRIIRQAQSDIEQAKLRLEEQKRGYQSLVQSGKISVSKIEQQLTDLNTQIAAAKSEIEQTKNQINSLKEQLEKYLIRAPFDGTIFQLPITREGAVVQPKQLIAEIARKGTPLVFKGQILTSESESLRSGNQQKDANLKFDEYPFQDYEVVKGKLSWVSPNSKITQTAQGNLTTYDVEIELSQSCIQPKSKCIAFKSGQPATAEIIIRQRRLIDFILDPFKKLQKGDLKL